MKRKVSRISKKAVNKLSVEELLKKNPDVSLAQKIMQQSRKTQKPAITLEQNNYYKLPESVFFS